MNSKRTKSITIMIVAICCVLAIVSAIYWRHTMQKRAEEAAEEAAMTKVELAAAEMEAAWNSMLQTNHWLMTSLSTSDKSGCWKEIQAAKPMTSWTDFICEFEKAFDRSGYANCSSILCQLYKYDCEFHPGGQGWDVLSVHNCKWESVRSKFLEKSLSYGINNMLQQEINMQAKFLADVFPDTGNVQFSRDLASCFSKFGLQKTMAFRRSVLKRATVDPQQVVSESQLLDLFRVRLFIELSKHFHDGK